jgi:hypothetical protein
MSHQSSAGAFAFAAVLIVAIGGAQAADDAKYPNWKGRWDPINPRLGGQAIKFDPTKAWGPAQQAPLTAEYQNEESMADQANDGDGRYDVLEVETRGPFKGPRAYDASGLPLDFDNESTFKERFHLDKKDPNLLHDEITVFDHALTRPWSVDKTFRRNSNPRPNWSLTSCTEGNNQVVIGTENYFLSGDGLLMPAKKDQAPPDLRYFKQTRK